MDAAPMVVFDPTLGDGATFDATFEEVLSLEAEKYAADPLGGSPSRY